MGGSKVVKNKKKKLAGAWIIICLSKRVLAKPICWYFVKLYTKKNAEKIYLGCHIKFFKRLLYKKTNPTGYSIEFSEGLLHQIYKMRYA